MRKSNKLLSATVAFAAVLAAPALYAHDAEGSQGSMMGQMGQMMESCNKMMQSMKHETGPKNPNEQWQKKG
jgi:hypothetical protein